MRQILNSLFAATITLGIALRAFAAGGEAHGHIPWGELLIPQIVNFVFFFSLLIYFTRGHIVGYFAKKAKNFEAAKNAAANAKKEAEANYAKIKAKIDQLQATAKAEIEKAKASSVELKKSLVAGAKAQAEKIQEDAHVSVRAELQRTILTLRTETISKAVSVAEEELTASKSNADLQKSFVARVQSARL